LKKCDVYGASRISVVGAGRPNRPARHHSPVPYLHPLRECLRTKSPPRHADQLYPRCASGWRISSTRTNRSARITAPKTAQPCRAIADKAIAALLNDNCTWPAIDYTGNSFAPYSLLHRSRVSRTEDKPSFSSGSFCRSCRRAFALAKTHYGQLLEIQQLGN